VGDRVLAPLNVQIADISILADGSLRISKPGTLRAGSNWYMLSNATDHHVGLTMVSDRRRDRPGSAPGGRPDGLHVHGLCRRDRRSATDAGGCAWTPAAMRPYVDSALAEIPEGGPQRSELVIIEVD
jgi:hypothetical protein